MFILQDLFLIYQIFQPSGMGCCIVYQIHVTITPIFVCRHIQTIALGCGVCQMHEKHTGK